MIHLVTGHRWTNVSGVSYRIDWNVAAFTDPEKAQTFADECEAYTRIIGDDEESRRAGPDKSGCAHRRAEYDVEEMEVK